MFTPPSEAWSKARLRAALIGAPHLPDWCVDVPAAGTATLYSLSNGRMWIAAAGLEPRCVEAGEIVLLPEGLAHKISADGNFANPQQVTATTSMRQEFGPGSGRARRVLAVTGYWEVATRAGLLGLPTIILAKPCSLNPVVAALLDACWKTSNNSEPVATDVGTLIANALIVAVLAEHQRSANDSKANTPSSLALADPVVLTALLSMQRAGGRISLHALAEEASVSRTTLISRFKLAMGQPPAQYRADLILAAAAEQLAGSRERISEIAQRAGFASEEAFSRAFKRRYGLPPAQWRRQSQMP